MQHKDQHHIHHEKERERKKKEKAAHAGKGGLPIHPGWLLVIGIALALVAVIIWTIFPR
jgi:hypothetical protein